MTALLRECTDISYIYGVLIVKNASAEEVQNKINEIKSGIDGDITIKNVLSQFPKKWKWSYHYIIEDLVI